MGGLNCSAVHKAERAFASYHAMGNNVKRIIVNDKRTKIETRDIFYGVFAVDLSYQFGVRAYFIAYVADFAYDLGVYLLEIPARILICGVKHGSVCQNDTHRSKYAVAVGVRTAIHTRGIVDDDAADHSRFF